MKADSPNDATRPDRKAGNAATMVLVCCVFVLYSFCRVPIPGVNEPHYLCKARAFYDAQWCSRDLFLHSANAHVVFFALFGAAAQVLPLAVVAIVGRIISLTLFGLAWVALGRRLSLSSCAIVLAACCFCGIAMTGNFSGEWVVGGLEGKVAAYGFALLAMSFWLDALQAGSRRRYAVSGVCAGLSVACHPVVGLWFCIGVALSEAAMFPFRGVPSEGSPKRTMTALVLDGLSFATVAFVVSLPGLVPALLLLTSGDAPAAQIERANYIQVFWRLAHHLDPGTFPARAWIHTLVLSGVCIAGFVGLQRLQPQSTRPPAWQPCLCLLVASAIIAAAGVVVGWHSGLARDMPDWQWRAAVLKFYPFRLFDALLPMTTALVVAGLLDTVVRRPGETPGTPNAVPESSATGRPNRGGNWLLGGVTLVSAGLVIMAALSQRPMTPAGYSRKHFADWKSACDWIRHHTPQDALVFTPRESFAFKWFAERAEYVCIKDCPQDTEGILGWNQRLWTIHGWANESFQDGRFDDADLERLRQQTGCNYVLTRRLGPFEAAPVFRNDIWRVYEISDHDSAVR